MQGSPNGPNPLFTLLILAGLTCCSNYFTTPAAGNTELRALMEIKSSLDPANNGSFVGVACNEHRKLVNISLQGKGLAEKLTPALTDLYLNFNNLTGAIPPEIGKMASLQVLQLSYNQLTGNMPTQMRSLKNLNFLALESNRLTGHIPSDLGNLRSLKSLHFGSNQLSGQIPYTLANNTSLELLDVKNNKLSGLIPPEKKYRFPVRKQLWLMWARLPRAQSLQLARQQPRPQPELLPIRPHGQSQSSIGCLRHSLQRDHLFGDPIKASQDRAHLGPDRHLVRAGGGRCRRFFLAPPPETEGRGQIRHVQWGPAHMWGPHRRDSFNLEEVESATQHFSEANLLGKSKFCRVYKGVLKGGSIVAVKCIGKTSCKSEEEEFLRGLGLLNSLEHENLVELKGLCRSKARGECFLIYNFAPGGNLSSYLDRDEVVVLDWKTRVSIIHGIAKGVLYLHSNETNKPPIIHQTSRSRLDRNMSPLILDAGLHGLLADDVVYSALKVSAALGYMAPEYITTGRFTEKSDVYAYGVIIFQLLCGKTMLPGPTRAAAEAGKLEEFIDPKLKGEFMEIEAQLLTRIALDCTNENPKSRPSMVSVVQELKSGMKSG
ncbi:leucine rich repeat receptor kinase [Striga asiatica]|uniref:Leucine rich repeat receptor kinase n=1 Tax=Striga asiatica TaxID=4170 RepID=A0A5A7PC63_STRAF|nr:leucine rich repeat receptor kinase [Striga asiatica]